MFSLIPIYGNGILWSVAPLLGWGRYAPEPFGLSCTLAWSEIPLSYTVTIFSVCYCLPLLLMMVCYGQMIASVRRATASMRNLASNKDNYLAKVDK